MSQFPKASKNPKHEIRNKFEFINDANPKPVNPSLDKSRNRGIGASFRSLENLSFRICFGFRVSSFDFGQRIGLRLCFARFLLAVNFLGLACMPLLAAEPSPAGRGQVSFIRDIKPVFESSCIKCHGRGRDKGGFRLDTRESLLEGGDSGSAVISGNSEESYLIELVSGIDPDNVMPQKGSKLTPEQVRLLRAWIDQGLPWDDNVTFARKSPINLLPRRPSLPALSAKALSSHSIDVLLQSYFEEHSVEIENLVDDRVFARRVFLDVIGVVPSPHEIEAFVADRGRNKREVLVGRLLNDNRRYAEHWLTFWNDLLRNDYRGTGYIDRGRKQITPWLYSALATNMPYDQFVASLVNPTSESEGFIKGIVWRGVVNASQKPPMQAAQNIAQVFMGINLKCASCHDSFIDDWTLEDSYGLASVYSDERLEMVQCDKPTGEFATMKFLYPELGSLDASASKSERLKQLADLITQKRNGRLSRTIVNRLWAKFFGRGLVEPIDDMESPAWNTDLLDWLAENLVDSGYDLKKTIKEILSSGAYQMPSVNSPINKNDEYVFRGPEVRRLTAEQFIDSLASVMGVGFTLPAAATNFDVAKDSDDSSFKSKPRAATPQWIWSHSRATEVSASETVYFRKRIVLAEEPTAASIVVTCDNSFRLFVNGSQVSSGKNYAKPKVLDVRSHFRKGDNIIAVIAVNEKVAKSDEAKNQSNPAGLFLYARVRHEKTIPIEDGTEIGSSDASATRIPVETVMDFASNSKWIWSAEKSENWEMAEFFPEGWQHAAELGGSDAKPWDIAEELAAVMSASDLYGDVRAALVNTDPLMTALGRPNREQLITRRSSVATTLQALELTNGETLMSQLERGAENLIRESGPTARELIHNLYLRSLSRTPTSRELRLSEKLVGTPVRSEGVEDLLWSVAMLPEFQLIY